MGYTHYFPSLTASPEVLADSRKIIDASSVTICGPKGQGLPILNDAEGIRLNGFEAAGEAHETFRLQGIIEPPYADMWSFCTTVNKPYDVVVMAILIAAAIRSERSLRSDGRWETLAAGVPFFEKAVRPLTEDAGRFTSATIGRGSPGKSKPTATYGQVMSRSGVWLETSSLLN